MVKCLSILRKTKSVKNINSLASIGEKTIIGEQVSFEGIIRGNEDLIINGSVKGSIELENCDLTVAPRGQVEAEIHAQNVSIRGQLIGNIKAISNVEITREADFSGQIKAKRVSIEDGASLRAAIELEHETQKKTLPTDTISDQEAYGSEKEALTLLNETESSAISTHLLREEGSLDSEPVTHTSNVIRLFIDGLERQQKGHVLDIGPVCSENINFLGQHVRTLYVCDMFLHLDRERRKDLPINSFWQHLDYPPQSFDGILLWDLIDHLEDNEVCRLVELCIKMLRPGGLVMVFSLGEQATQTAVNSFAIKDSFQLYLRPQPHLDLPFHTRHNREVLALLVPFTLVKSFIYHNGLRQFLFRRD
jgi:cytoskeletal protein CcmA (bactofilin family)